MIGFGILLAKCQHTYRYTKSVSIKQKGLGRPILLVMAIPRQVLHNSIYGVLKFSISLLSTPMKI